MNNANIEVTVSKAVRDIEVNFTTGSGPAGLSAYQTAVLNGYVGTEGEWLASLKGDSGDTGAQGPKGDTGAAFTYSDFTAEQLAALQGPKGDTGAQGDKGDKGDTGAQGESAIVSQQQVTLSAASWDTNYKTYSLSLSGISASTIGRIDPEPFSYTPFCAAGIRICTVATGEITFLCDVIPSEDISIYITIERQ